MTGVCVNSEKPTPDFSSVCCVFHFLLLMLWKNENHFWGFLFFKYDKDKKKLA